MGLHTGVFLWRNATGHRPINFLRKTQAVTTSQNIIFMASIHIELLRFIEPVMLDPNTFYINSWKCTSQNGFLATTTLWYFDSHFRFKEWAWRHRTIIQTRRETSFARRLQLNESQDSLKQKTFHNNLVHFKKVMNTIPISFSEKYCI